MKKVLPTLKFWITKLFFILIIFSYTACTNQPPLGNNQKYMGTNSVFGNLGQPVAKWEEGNCRYIRYKGKYGTHDAIYKIGGMNERFYYRTFGVGTIMTILDVAMFAWDAVEITQTFYNKEKPTVKILHFDTDGTDDLVVGDWGEMDISITAFPGCNFTNAKNDIVCYNQIYKSTLTIKVVQKQSGAVIFEDIINNIDVGKESKIKKENIQVQGINIGEDHLKLEVKLVVYREQYCSNAPTQKSKYTNSANTDDFCDKLIKVKYPFKCNYEKEALNAPLRHHEPFRTSISIENLSEACLGKCKGGQNVTTEITKNTPLPAGTEAKIMGSDYIGTHFLQPFFLPIVEQASYASKNMKEAVIALESIYLRNNFYIPTPNHKEPQFFYLSPVFADISMVVNDKKNWNDRWHPSSEMRSLLCKGIKDNLTQVQQKPELPDLYIIDGDNEPIKYIIPNIDQMVYKEPDIAVADIVMDKKQLKINENALKRDLYKILDYNKEVVMYIHPMLQTIMASDKAHIDWKTTRPQEVGYFSIKVGNKGGMSEPSLLTIKKDNKQGVVLCIAQLPPIPKKGLLEVIFAYKSFKPAKKLALFLDQDPDGNSICKESNENNNVAFSIR